MIFEWSATIDALPMLLRGAPTTVMIAAVSLLAGMALGTIIGVVRAYAPASLAMVLQLYVGLVRGTPLVVQIMFIYFALPILLGVRLDAITAGMIVVTHEISFARDVGSRLLFIDQGKILHDGDPRALLENPPSERLAVFLQHIR